MYQAYPYHLCEVQSTMPQNSANLTERHNFGRCRMEGRAQILTRNSYANLSCVRLDRNDLRVDGEQGHGVALVPMMDISTGQKVS